MTRDELRRLGFSTIVATVFGIAIALVLITFLVIVPGLGDKQRRNDMTLFQSALREYMTQHKNTAPSDSGSKLDNSDLSTSDGKSVQKLVVNLQDSHSLDNYLQDSIGKSKFTNRYFVTNADVESDVSVVAWKMPEWKAGKVLDSIFVYVGGRCTDDIQHNKDYFFISNTTLRNDVAVFRALHNGKWLCSNLN